MKRYGKIIRLKPEMLEEYKKLHSAVWEGVLAQIKYSNIQNYSIFYKDGLLFSYYEYIGADHDADMRAMAADPLTQAWWKLTAPCQEPYENTENGEWWASMEEFFHTD
jgi:L-rhamnose mutarotase